MLGLLEKRVGTKGFQCFRCLALRCLSTDLDLSEKSDKKITKQRRFTKPHSIRKSTPFPENFVTNLFIGVFDKEIFNYPSVLQNEEVDSLLRHSVEVEDCLNNSIKPNSELTSDLVKDLQKVELFGLSVPQKYGGLGYTETETKFIQECTGVNPKIGRFLAQGEDNVVKLLTLFGSEEQKTKYLPRLAAGESFGTLAYLENAPLIDISSFQALGIVDEVKGGYILNGKKKWVLNANVADLIVFLAKTSSVQDEEFVSSGFDLFIMEKNTPGLSVHQLKSAAAQEFALYEVDLENVFVPRASSIGIENHGYLALKTVLSHSQLSSAVLCLSFMKRMIHSLIQFSEDKVLASKAIVEYQSVQFNIGLLTSFIYGLESVVYNIAGRFDLYGEPDLFLESCIAKILAVEMLQRAIQIYMQIFGLESFKSPGLLNEAIKLLQYNSVLDENNIYLKLLVGSSGILHSASPLAKKTKKLRQAHNHPMETFKWFMTSDKKKISSSKAKHNLKMELHVDLSREADNLESSLAKLEVVVQELLYLHGNNIVEEETMLARLGEMAAYIYAHAICLARASTSYCNRMPNSETDINAAQGFGFFAQAKIEHLNHQLRQSAAADTLCAKIGDTMFRSKEYAVAHPLSRVY